MLIYVKKMLLEKCLVEWTAWVIWESNTLKTFLKIYKYRPIKDNKNGMKINYMFAFFIKNL